MDDCDFGFYDGYVVIVNSYWRQAIGEPGLSELRFQVEEGVVVVPAGVDSRRSAPRWLPDGALVRTRATGPQFVPDNGRQRR